MNKSKYWYYNRTDRNITIYDLDITLPSKKVVELKTMKPSLKEYIIRNSEYCGDLRRKVEAELVKKLSGPPKKEEHKFKSRFSVSNNPIASRARSIVEVSPEDKYFIENLEGEYLNDVGALPQSERSAINDKFIAEEDLDGFYDPLSGKDSIEE